MAGELVLMVGERRQLLPIVRFSVFTTWQLASPRVNDPRNNQVEAILSMTWPGKPQSLTSAAVSSLETSH